MMNKIVDRAMAAAGLLFNPLVLVGFLMIGLVLAMEWVWGVASGQVKVTAYNQA